MSAVYLHNSIYTRESLQGRANVPPHSRNLSTVSSVTVQTDSTFHSHPTEPLLPPSNSSRDTYFGGPTRETGGSRVDVASPSIPNHPWASPNLTEENTFVETEKPTHWKPARRRASKRWSWARIAFEIAIGGWAIYNAVRYFLSFTMFESNAGQTASLALGISSGLCFAFLVCASTLSFFQSQLVLSGLSNHSVSTMYWTLTYTSLLFLFAPAAVNFALLFAWKDSPDLQLRMKYRCYMDIDVVWSRRAEYCRGQASTWGFWVVLSTLRLLVTALFIFGYHFILVKIRRINPIKPRRFRDKHRHKPSDAGSFHSSHVNGVHPISETPTTHASASQVNLDSRHLASDASLLSSRTGRSPRGLRLQRSHSSGLLSAESHRNPPTSLLASVPEQERESGDFGGFSDRFTSLVSQIHRETDDALEFARSDGDRASSRYTGDSSPRIRTASPEQEHEWTSSSDDDDGAENGDTTVRQSNHDEGEEDDFYGNRPTLPPVLGYNEFGQPYPADTQVPMMNGLVRRMPTIESMGSREMGSSIAASSLLADGNTRHSFQTRSSRPPTRNTLLSMLSADGLASRSSTPSEPSSRTNSLMVQAERLAALGLLTGTSNASADSPNPTGTGTFFHNSSSHDISEIGELIDTVHSVKKVPPPESPSGSGKRASRDLDDIARNLFFDHEDDRYLDSTNGSRSTKVSSYHTATMGSGKSPTEEAFAPPGLTPS
ncbi:hypothetical protein CC2G_002001 [Coprinopsis cinerea AmutBmut pab1-1]|nr:hypothetical protein CC2G_002001 [Coprinopsis cinerea AmutBmut pab1-1]